MDMQKEVKQEIKFDSKEEALLKKKRRARKTPLKIDETSEPIKETIEEVKPDIVETNEVQCECKAQCKCETQHESWFAKIYKAIVDFFKKIF